MQKKIKRKNKSSAHLLRQGEEIRKQECFNIGLHYADILGAKHAAEKFIQETFDAQDKIWNSYGEEWSETLQEYAIHEDDDASVMHEKYMKRAFTLLAFFASGCVHLTGKIAKQWNGKDYFRKELADGNE